MPFILAIVYNLVDRYGTDYSTLAMHFIELGEEGFLPLIYYEENKYIGNDEIDPDVDFGQYYIVDTSFTEGQDGYYVDGILRDWTGYSEDQHIYVGDSTEEITNPICFAKGTIVSTDQGNMEIQNIIPGKHTIGEKEICHITKTISPEKKIVCVKKNAFGKNKPNKAITMSGNHCIQFEKGDMVKAKELVVNNPKMKFVEYNQEPLYNVLMEDHNVIKVQNLEVETLDPENLVAKIHNSLMDKSTLAKLVKQMNEGIMENNREKYITAEHAIRSISF